MGWEDYILVVCFLLDSACPFISFRLGLNEDECKVERLCTRKEMAGRAG